MSDPVVGAVPEITPVLVFRVTPDGKAPAETYVEEPFPYKVREKDAIQRHLDADDRMNKIDMKIKYYDTMLKFLEEIIRAVSNRTYQIKNAIDWKRFMEGSI